VDPSLSSSSSRPPPAGLGDRLVGTVFPTAVGDLSYKQVRNREILSSTLLQQLLYFHMYLSLVTFVVLGFVLRWKVNNNSGIFVVAVMPAAFLAWAAVETTRLYVGFSGNLHEHVPQLAAFFFLCVFPQLLLLFFFMFIQRPLLPIDRILAILHLVFVLVEMFVSWRATNRMINAKTARFPVEFGGWLSSADVASEDPAVAAAAAAVAAALRENDELVALREPHGALSDDIKRE
jgi:hypothetical protein